MTSSQLKKLISMEKTERFLFHGSGLRLEILEPRQAYTVVDGVNLPDGPPAIFATHLVDYALFMALINRDTCPLGTRYGCAYEEGLLKFTASSHTLNQLGPETRGYVHVLERDCFTLRGGSEWLSLRPVSVSKENIIEVKWSDFNQPIEEVVHEL